MLGLTLAGSMASRLMADAMSLYRRSFPHTVRVETTNHCQAACTFCPRDRIGRPKGFMPQDLFESIIRQCAEGECRVVHLHGFGEPLLDKRLSERIRFCKQLGIGRVKIFTNGGLLDEALSRELVESGLDEVKISIDGADAMEFNELRVGLNHQSVLSNVKRLREIRDANRAGTPTIIAATCQTSNRQQTEAMLERVVDRIEFTGLHNWAGALGMHQRRRVRKPCDRLWRTLTVLANGDVALCCLDYSGKEILGSAVHERLADIWNNERYRQLRQLHRDSRQAEIPLCKNCSKCFF